MGTTTSSFMDYGGYEKDAASTKHAHTLAPTQVLSPTHIARDVLGPHRVCALLSQP